jgi:hypothetical protein
MFGFGKKNNLGSFSLETSKKVAYSRASSRPRMDGIIIREKTITEEVKSVSVPIEIPKKVVYSRASSRPQVDGIIRREKIVTEVESTIDNNKRTFLKVAGATGFGLAATVLFPKAVDAYVAGSTPTSNVVGVKNSSNARINPATEETVSTLATEATTATLLKTSDLTFDAGSLQVKVTSLPSGSSTSSFSDSGGVDKKGLVDVDRHVQVDVLSSELPSSASTETTLQTIAFGGTKYALRLATVGEVDYVGEATIGTAESAELWRIKKVDSTSGISITWAGGGGFNKAWSGYAGHTYS